MNLLLLGGQSINNKGWIEEIKEATTRDFDEVEYINYKHWQDGDKQIHIDYEIEKIAKLTANWKSYIVFAKSMGAVIVLKALYEGKIKPASCVLAGFPYSLAERLNLNIESWFIDLKIPTLLLQKELDPYGSFEDMRVKIKNENIQIQKYEREDEPNNDHHYADIQYLRSEIVRIANES